MTLVEQIASRELDAVIVYESERVIAFADHEPINFGHIIIAPKYPYASFIDLPDDIISEINQVAKLLYNRIESKFSPNGISFIQNNGEFNDLSHYHLHIFPRFEGDGFGWTSASSGVQSIEVLQESLAGL